MYEKGQIVKRDTKRAQELYKRACKNGSMLGCAYLGYLYKNGTKELKADTNQAVSYFIKSCNRDEVEGC
jgi:TPR repeat protein